MEQGRLLAPAVEVDGGWSRGRYYSLTFVVLAQVTTASGVLAHCEVSRVDGVPLKVKYTAGAGKAAVAFSY